MTFKKFLEIFKNLNAKIDDNEKHEKTHNNKTTKSKLRFFNENKDKILQIIDEIIQKNIEIRRIEDLEIYSERVSLTVDELYYQKLEELAEKYKMPISTLIRNIIFQLS